MGGDDTGRMKRSVPEGEASVRVGSNLPYKRVMARRDGDTLEVYGPSWTIALESADEAALLDALLRERGYEERWAARTPHNLLQLTETEDIARGMVDAANNTSWVKGVSTAVPIYVPLQRESE